MGRLDNNPTTQKLILDLFNRKVLTHEINGLPTWRECLATRYYTRHTKTDRFRARAKRKKIEKPSTSVSGGGSQKSRKQKLIYLP